jgi:hypothetical protein
MEHRGIEYQIKIGITKHEWAWSIRTSPPKQGKVSGSRDDAVYAAVRPSNNGATNTPMTADHQTGRPPQFAASNYATRGNFSGARQVPGLWHGESSMAEDEYRRNAIECLRIADETITARSRSC